MKVVDSKILAKKLNRRQLTDLHFGNLQQLVCDQITDYDKPHLSNSSAFDVGRMNKTTVAKKDAREVFSPDDFSDDAFCADGLNNATNVSSNIELRGFREFILLANSRERNMSVQYFLS